MTIGNLVRTLSKQYTIWKAKLVSALDGLTLSFRTEDDDAYIDTAHKSTKLHGTNESESVALTAPAGLSESTVYYLPDADGVEDEVLSTDGSGNLFWQTLPDLSVVDASEVTYTPSVVEVWDGDLDPGDVDNALDQLADRVDTLETTPPGSPDASTTTYTPADGADPGNVDGALDNLRARAVLLETEQQQIFYVGKHGNDANSGLRIEIAFLTIQAAINAAVAGTPSATNRYTIIVLDGGIYTEVLTGNQYVSILATNAILAGTVDIYGDCYVEFYEVRATSNGQELIDKRQNNTSSYVKVSLCDSAGFSNVTNFRNAPNNGILFIDVGEVVVGQDGLGFGDAGSGTVGYMHISHCGDLYLAGNNAIGMQVDANKIIGFIDHILETGTPTGTVAIEVGATGEAYLIVDEIKGDTVYSVTTGGVLRLFTGNLVGSVSGDAVVLALSSVTGTGANVFADNPTLNGLVIDGISNEIQLLIEGNATQTADLLKIRKSGGGADQFVIDDLGGIHSVITDNNAFDAAKWLFEKTTQYGVGFEISVPGGGLMTEVFKVTLPSAGDDAFTIDDDGQVIINNSGSTRNTRVEGTSDANLWVANGTNDRIGIGTDSPGDKLDVRGGLIVNEDSADVDIRFESNGDAYNYFSDGGNDNNGMGTGTPDASSKLDIVSTSKGLLLPRMTEEQRNSIASPANELLVITSDWHMLDQYDSVRWRAASHIGYCPYAFPRGTDFGSAHNATSVSIPANGGTWLFPIDVLGHMQLRNVTIYQTATSGQRTWAWDLYVDALNNSNTLTRIATSNGSDTFTPGAASFRSLAATSAPVYLRPGPYWLAIQNRHATNTFVPGVANTPLDWGTNYQEKVTTNPNGGTLDVVLATWTKPIARTVMVRLEGDVFGTGAVYT